MAPRAKRRRSNGARRRKRIRTVSANERWLHLSALDEDTHTTLQTLWRRASFLCSYSSFLLALMTVVQNSNAPHLNQHAVVQLVTHFTRQTTCYLALLRFWRRLDHILYDIPEEQEKKPRMLMLDMPRWHG